MNLQLHGIENPSLIGKDALSEANANVKDQFTLVLANPPFKGSLDYDSVESSILAMVKTKKTELLFLGLILRILRTGGRCAVIVPDGVLFGSSNAHKQIRQELVENQRLQAIISMPSGVFKPYAGVSTAILLFTKTNSGGTENVWFYDMKADGFSLDDKRTPLVDNQPQTLQSSELSPSGEMSEGQRGEDYHSKNNIPDILQKWNDFASETKQSPLTNRKAQCFTVPFSELKAYDWDLSINRYKEIVYEEVKYDA